MQAGCPDTACKWTLLYRLSSGSRVCDLRTRGDLAVRQGNIIASFPAIRQRFEIAEIHHSPVYYESIEKLPSASWVLAVFIPALTQGESTVAIKLCKPEVFG